MDSPIPIPAMDTAYLPNQPKSLSGIALRAFCLGAALALSLTAIFTLLWIESPLWRVPFLFASLALFHFLEFWTTAAYNTREATVGAYLLTSNWPAFAIAHASATVECFVTNAFFPNRAWLPGPLAIAVTIAGVLLVVAGQVIRSVAMIQAGTSFNHIVQHRKASTHTLVTHGVYAYVRHPSYLGFFWWSVGTQLAQGNLLCTIGFAVVTWRFFSTRIAAEERSLVTFFGSEYLGYRGSVRTWIPFIP